jgi:UDPglucose--hexose-1-phosphate uridylyltransferase
VRIVLQNEHFITVVPFWAIWPFETLVLPLRHTGALTQMASEEKQGLADILKRLTTRYDNLFRSEFPYSMGFHQAPADGQAHPEFHWHAHFYPPLLRSSRIRKFLVGYEMLANPQRDITPELAANRLANLPEIHYCLTDSHNPVSK